MPIDFHSEQNRFTYANRSATTQWQAMIAEIIDVRGKKVVDVGCGGGIYSQALAQMGASQVTGIDFSAAMLESAREQASVYPNITFKVGDALHTGLPEGSCDLVLARALTHHLQPTEIVAFFTEVVRILQAKGILIIQNRTPQDCALPGSEQHVRGYFFERYPQLLEKEFGRRQSSETIIAAMQQAGFQDISERLFWETREVYTSVDSLLNDLRQRKGRSILHELSDAELQALTKYIREQFRGHDGAVVDKDRWSIWWGKI